MRKLSSIFLVGLCLGAIGAVVVTVSHGRAAAPEPIAVAEAVTSLPDSPPTADPASATATPTPTPTPTASAAEAEPRAGVKAAALDRLVPGGNVSAVVFDRQRGATNVSVRGDRGYTSASLVKLLIALTALDSGGPTAQVQRMLSRSDDELASRFWATYGGPSIVTHWAKKIGLTGTRPPADPGRWGDTRVTANDIVRIYQYLLGHSPAILNALRDATEHGSDSFRQYFGIPDAAAGRPWAVKQGWSCCMPTRMLHTSGVVGEDDRYIVVVLTEHPSSVDYATGSKRVTAVVTALLG